MKSLYSNPILLAAAKIVFYGAMTVLIYYLMLIDSRYSTSTGKFGEKSYTEFAQEIFLLMGGLIYSGIALQRPKVRGLAILLAGACFTALIREYNNYMHNWFRGSWQLIALIICITTAFYAWRNRQTILKPLQKYLKTPSFGITISAFLIIMIFSRLYGLHDIWYNILEEELTGKYRWVKNAAEEGTELLGYCFLFFGAVEYYLHLHKKVIMAEVKKEKPSDPIKTQ